MSPIIFNQQILRKEEFQISIANRAFLYGDGLFESVKIINGKPFNLDAHLKRLFSASLLLHLEINISRNDLRVSIYIYILIKLEQKYLDIIYHKSLHYFHLD